MIKLFCLCLLLWHIGASLSPCIASIQSFSVLDYLPGPVSFGSSRKLGSNVVLNLSFTADAGVYTVNAYRNSDLSQIVATKIDIRHLGGEAVEFLRVPLTEGDNEFFLRLVEISAAGGEKTTSTVDIPLVRDLEFEVSQVRLNHIEAEGEDAGQIIGLYTRKPTVSLFYTINGNAKNYQVFVLRNGTEVHNFLKDGAGSDSVSGIELETGMLNLLQLQVSSTDVNGVSLGVQAESNIIRIFHNTNPPQILSIEATFQTAAPPAGTPWGPTDLASIGIRTEVRGVDLHGAEILITDTSSGKTYRRRVQNDGRHTISGIELPADTSLGPVAITTTIYEVRLTDAAGNFSVDTINIERLLLEPCFNLLFMRPEDGEYLKNNEAVSIVGAVCSEPKPHKIVFYIASLFSEFSYYREEQIKNLYGGQFFDKDISLPIYSESPNDNMAYSIQAEVVTTHPTDPNREVISPRHDLGTIIFDRKPPLAPNIFTEKVLLATNSPSFTVDGDIERWSNLEVVAPTSFFIRTARNIASTGDEFRIVVDLGVVNDGDYMLDLVARDRAGNIGPGSINHVTVNYDRSKPQVKVLKVNDSPVEPSKPLFVKPGQVMRLQVLLDKKMKSPPRVWVTEQGAFASEAGMYKVITEGYEYEYQYVIRESQDGQNDGWVEVLVTGGRDMAGNVLTPSFREPRAFVIDTLPPVLQRNNVIPTDGSVLNAPPAPIRFVMSEHPRTKDIGSGPNPLACHVSCFGPLEETPHREIGGRLEVFDPRTIDFYPFATEMNIGGTYLFRIDMVDKVGNNFVETVVLELDLIPLSTHLIVQEFPIPDFYYNAETLPHTTDTAMPYISVTVEESLTKEMALDKTQAVVSNFLRAPQNFPLSVPEIINTTEVRFSFLQDVQTDGSDDGVFVANVRLTDRAGNISDENTFTWYYDTLAPQVIDGFSFPLPPGYEQQDLRFPASGTVINGPLNVLSAVVFDVKSPTGFLGSGLKTDINSTIPFSTTTITLSVQQSFGSVEPGFVVSGRIKFKGDLSGGAPIFGGPQVSRVLYELNVDPRSLEPLGLATDGSFDGIYRMEVLPFDMSLNQGDTSTAFFLYDTLAPQLSVDVDNEVWITSSIIELSGWAADQGSRPAVHPNFGSLYGMGVQTVELRVEAVNELGSATIPALIDWRKLTLDKKPALYPADEKFLFNFSERFRAYSGAVRLTVRAFDKAGNEGRFIRDLRLDDQFLADPVLASPLADSYCTGGIIRFRWQPVEKAQRYLLELTDAELNAYKYEYEKGTVEADINLNMLPAGRTVWKVIALDGIGQRSPGANGRFLNIDRDLPGIDSFVFNKPVAPPDNEGRILEALLRFQVEFTKELDETGMPQVEFLPSSKQYLNSLGQLITETYPPIALETIEFKGRSYTGIFRVRPASEDHDYNGIAALQVRNYFDLAGNPGEAWTEYFELDLGPYFDFRVFSNPVQEKELIFMVKSLHQKGGKEEELVSVPLMKVRQLKNPLSPANDDPLQIVKLSRLSGAHFYGAYILNLNYSGTLRIEITGEDKDGNSITRILPFQISRLSFSPQAAFVHQSVSSIASEKEVLRCFFPWFTHQELGSGSIPLRNVFPADDLTAEVEQVFSLADYRVLPDGKYAVVKKHAATWEYIPQQRKENDIILKSRYLSSLFLIEDVQAPVLELAHSSDELQELSDDLHFSLYDEGVGLDLSNSSFLINNRSVEAVATGEEFLLRRNQMRIGEVNNILLTGVDYLGNSIKKTLTVVPVGEMRIDQAVVVPNPVRTKAIVSLRMNRAADLLYLSLYDAASRRIANLEKNNIKKSATIILDDILTNLANGVYFLRLTVYDSDGAQDKKIIKFAILR